MRRSDASPEADTTSYSPVLIRLTASSEVPKYFTVAWQPVAFSNGVTQSVFGSLLPSSAYPGQARMDTAPSPLPSCWSMSIFGAVKPWLLGVSGPESDVVPQAAVSIATDRRARTLRIGV